MKRNNNPTTNKALACTGLETAITRTPLATALILSNLSGQTGVTVPCLASAMVSLYITLYRPFISSQRDRSDVIIKVQNYADYTKYSKKLVESKCRNCGFKV